MAGGCKVQFSTLTPSNGIRACLAVNRIGAHQVGMQRPLNVREVIELWLAHSACLAACFGEVVFHDYFLLGLDRFPLGVETELISSPGQSTCRPYSSAEILVGFTVSISYSTP